MMGYRQWHMKNSIMRSCQLCRKLGACQSEKTAYRLASGGKLPGFKAGGSWRFKRGDIEKWIEENKGAPGK